MAWGPARPEADRRYRGELRAVPGDGRLDLVKSGSLQVGVIENHLTASADESGDGDLLNLRLRIRDCRHELRLAPRQKPLLCHAKGFGQLSKSTRAFNVVGLYLLNALLSDGMAQTRHSTRELHLRDAQLAATCPNSVSQRHSSCYLKNQQSGW